MPVAAEPSVIGVAEAPKEDQAVKALEGLVRARPNNEALRRTLSLTYRRAGRIAEADEQLRQADLLKKPVPTVAPIL